MTKIREIVWNGIARSPSVRLDLARGLINTRALAKRFQANILPNASLDAIISAIRRYEEERPFQETYEEARDIIRGAKLSSKNHLASVTLAKAEDVLAKLEDIFTEAGPSAATTLRIVQAQHAVKVIVDEDAAERVAGIFPQARIRSIERGMGEVVIDLSKAAWETPGVLGILSQELWLHGVNIRECLTCMPEMIFLFDEKDLMEAFDVLYRKTGRDVASRTPR
ncbi:hypothetical protein JXB02_01615 [Candidatus Woesearchaeota archaeon]|nr:hypothetical protein [Candidatus Woesearchaeota archaeon]